MGVWEDAKDKVEDVKDDAMNKLHEEKGRMEGKREQSEKDDDRTVERDDLDDDDDLL